MSIRDPKETKGWAALRAWVDRYVDESMPAEKWEQLDERKREWRALRALADMKIVDCAPQSAQAWLYKHARPSGLLRITVSRVIGCEPEDWETEDEREKREEMEAML